jgi:translation initiation factor 1
MMKGRNQGGLVFSTEGGTMCPACRKPVAQCSCGQVKAAGTPDGIVRVSRETKGRAGKCVTLIKGIALDPAAMTALTRRLKAASGAGGTVKDGVIELQGDHCEAVILHLRQQGWPAKRTGS